jgi:hypothetical protein
MPPTCHFTPLKELSQLDGHYTTPQQFAVIAAKAFAQELDIKILQSLVKQVTSVIPRTQRRILFTKEVKTWHNLLDLRLDLRGKKRVLTRLNIAAISDYLNDSTTSLTIKASLS